MDIFYRRIEDTLTSLEIAEDEMKDILAKGAKDVGYIMFYPNKFKDFGDVNGLSRFHPMNDDLLPLDTMSMASRLLPQPPDIQTSARPPLTLGPGAFKDMEFEHSRVRLTQDLKKVLNRNA